MQVTVKTKHFRKSTKYSNGRDCPLYHAVVDSVDDSEAEVVVAPGEVAINGVEYTYPQSQFDDFLATPGVCGTNAIDLRINECRNNSQLEFDDIIVELTEADV